MQGFDAIKSEVIQRLGNRTDINSRVERWINMAFFELLLNPRASFFELDKSVNFSDVAGQQSYNLATIAPDLWFILDITDLDNTRKLQRTHWMVIDKVTGTTGQPTRYYRFGLTVAFDPTPDASYQNRLRYRIRPPDVTTGSNFLGLGTEWEEVITVMSVIKGYEALDQREKAQGSKQMLELLMQTRLDVPTLEDEDAETTIAPALRVRL